MWFYILEYFYLIKMPLKADGKWKINNKIYRKSLMYIIGSVFYFGKIIKIKPASFNMFVNIKLYSY